MGNRAGWKMMMDIAKKHVDNYVDNYLDSTKAQEQAVRQAQKTYETNSQRTPRTQVRGGYSTGFEQLSDVNGHKWKSLVS